MTVSSLVPVNNYTGNSYSKKFDFDFLIEKESELKVYLINSSGYSTLLENGIDYSINEIGNPNGSYITFPLSSSKYDVLNSDEKLSLALDLVIKQENEFKNSLYFNFDVLEWTFDYIIRILQIFSRRFERAVLVTEGAGVTPAELLNNIEESESAAKTYSEISKAYSAKVSEGLEFLKRIKENINYSVNEEMTLNLVDFLLRRTNYVLFQNDELMMKKDAFVDEMARIMEWNEEEKAAAAKQLDETIAESSLAYLK